MSLTERHVVVSIAATSKDQTKHHWCLYDVDDRHELFMAAEFYGTRQEVDKRYPQYLPRLKVWNETGS